MEQDYHSVLEGGEQPQHKRERKQDAIYKYMALIFGNMEPEVAFTLLEGLDAKNIMTLLRLMLAKKGLEYFRKSSADASM